MHIYVCVSACVCLLYSLRSHMLRLLYCLLFLTFYVMPVISFMGICLCERISENKFPRAAANGPIESYAPRVAILAHLLANYVITYVQD